MDINEAIKLLGIEGDDDELIIKKKYRMMQKKWHPDLYQKAIPSELAYAEVMSKKINQAMELINDYISRYGLSAFRHEFFSTTAITHNNINYRTQERSNIYWDKNVDYFDYYFSKANDNPDAYKSSFGGFFSEQFTWVLSKANAFKFSKINAYFCDLKLKNCYYSFEPQILYTDESIDFSETQQIRISRFVNGGKTNTFSIRNVEGKEIGVLSKSSALYYECILLPLFEAGMITLQNVVLDAYSSRKLCFQYEINSVGFNEVIIYDTPQNLSAISRKYNWIYRDILIKGKKPFKKKYSTGGLTSGHDGKLRIDNFCKKIRYPRFFMDMPSMLEYTVSSADYDVNKYDAEKNNFSDVHGKIKIFDYDLPDETIKSILSFCNDLDGWLTGISMWFMCHFLDDRRNEGTWEPMYYYESKNFVALVKFDSESSYFTNSRDDKFYYTTDFNLIVQFVAPSAFVMIKEIADDYGKTRKLTENQYLSKKLVQMLKESSIKTIDDLIERGPFSSWEKVREYHLSVSYEDLINMLKFARGSEIITDTDKKIIWNTIYNSLIPTIDDDLELQQATDREYEKLFHPKPIIIVPQERKNPSDEDELLRLKNIGKKFADMLHDIGVHTVDDLNKHSTEDLWRNLKEKNPQIGYIEIYAIEGAKRGIKMSSLTPETKAYLKKIVDS